MAEVEFAGITTSIEATSHNTHRYHLKVKFSDEETPEDKNRIYINSIFSLLDDVDPEDVDQHQLARSMQRRIQEGSGLSPRSRQEVTVHLVQLALREAEDRIDFDGDVAHITGVEVEERTTIRETPYDDMDWGDG